MHESAHLRRSVGGEAWLIGPCGLLTIPEVDAAYIYLTDEQLPPGRNRIPVDLPGGIQADIVLDWRDGKMAGLEVLGAASVLHSTCKDPPGGPSLEHPDTTGLPANPATDPRNATSSAVIARTPVLGIPGSAVVGRVFMFDANGQPAFAHSLGGQLNLAGFDVCELLLTFSVSGHQARKTLYAT